MRAFVVGLMCSGMIAGVISTDKVMAQNKAASTPRLSAPTYYISAEVSDCEPESNHVSVRGATNLPPRSTLAVKIGEIYKNGMKDMSAETYIEVDGGGFFEGIIIPKKGERVRRNLIANVAFYPFRPKQKSEVLSVVGKKGENLSRVKSEVLVAGDQGRPTVNPQILNFSGDYQGLYTIAIVGNCGEE